MLTIDRAGKKVFSGATKLSQMKRTPEELAGWLFVLEPTFDEWRTQLWQSSDAPAFMGKAEFLQAFIGGHGAAPVVARGQGADA